MTPNVNGHVPVGRGNPLPVQPRVRQNGRRVVNNGAHGPRAVVVKAPRHPVRQIPPAARAQMRGRRQVIKGRGVQVVVKRPLRRVVRGRVVSPGVVRQIPGTEAAVVTRK